MKSRESRPSLLLIKVSEDVAENSFGKNHESIKSAKSIR